MTVLEQNQFYDYSTLETGLYTHGNDVIIASEGTFWHINLPGDTNFEGENLIVFLRKELEIDKPEVELPQQEAKPAGMWVDMDSLAKLIAVSKMSGANIELKDII